MIYKDEFHEINIQNGIMICRVHVEKTITKDIAEHMINQRLRICNGKKFKTVLVYRGKVSFTREATKLLAAKGKEGISVVAIIFPNLINRTLGNFMLNTFYRRDEFPMKIFDNEVVAIEWINSFDIES